VKEKDEKKDNRSLLPSALPTQPPISEAVVLACLAETATPLTATTTSRFMPNGDMMTDSIVGVNIED
jgi:hypothetical protein